MLHPRYLKPGTDVTFNHHDGDFKWYRRVGTIHSSAVDYVLIKDETKPLGFFQVEAALLIDPEDVKKAEERRRREELF